MKSPNNTNTSGKRHQDKINTNQKSSKKSSSPFNYRKIKIRNINFKTSSQAAIYLLENTLFSQSEIARRCNLSQPCVCQLAQNVVRKVRATAKAK